MSSFFFFNDTATTEIYTLSLHDALPICTAQTLYFDELGNFTSASSTSTSTYRLDVAFPPTSGLTRAPTNVKLTLTWPAQADPVNAAGKAQMFASFDRH